MRVARDERRRRAGERRDAAAVAQRRLLGRTKRTRSKRDVERFRPNVQFRYQRELEPPDPAEGFTRIDVVPFERRHDPSFTNRARDRLG